LINKEKREIKKKTTYNYPCLL